MLELICFSLFPDYFIISHFSCYFDFKQYRLLLFPGSLDFPAINASVHKDVIEVSFQHPFMLHQRDVLKEEFMYTITHDEVGKAVAQTPQCLSLNVSHVRMLNC